MQDYLDLETISAFAIPTRVATTPSTQLLELAACVSRKEPATWKSDEGRLQEAAHRPARLAQLDGELVIVPTSSLYIECLVGTHPLLEDFKLIHRALDVKKVQAEVRHAELENIRLAARALEGEREDPGHR